MDTIRRHWRGITLALIVGSYITFIFIMDKRSDLFIPAIGIYLVVTAILFLSSLVGVPGILIHTIVKNETAAIPFYKAAISLGSKNVNILTAYGLTCLRDFRPKEARELFEEALKHSRHYMFNKTITANIALCLWKENDVPAAAKKYEELYYFPDLEKIEDYSLENLAEGNEKNHNFTAQDFTTMGYLMHLNDENEKAEYYSRVSLLKLDTYGPAYDNLGQIEYSKGNRLEAKEYFDKGLNLKPDMSDSLYYLAKISLDEKNYEQALNYLKEIDKSKINGLSTITEERVNTLIDFIEKIK